MLISILLSIGLFIYLKRNKNFTLLNIIALVAGCLGFALYGLSLMLQATAVEYAFDLYNSTNDAYAQSFSLYLYEWSMLGGGFSVSIYILANLCLATCVIFHFHGLYVMGCSNRFSIFCYDVALLLMLFYIFLWLFFMYSNIYMIDYNE